MKPTDKLHELSGSERLGQMRESEYLGAEDIDDDAEPILTIASLYNGLVTLQRGKENKDVIEFAEDKVPGILNVRPLIVNATNRKALKKLYGKVDAATLVNKQIQLYVDHHVRDPQDGGMTDGIRIKAHKPVAKQPVSIICSDCGNKIESAAGKSPEWLSAYTIKHYGRPLCAICAAKAKMAQEQPKTPENTAPVEAEVMENDATDK